MLDFVREKDMLGVKRVEALQLHLSVSPRINLHSIGHTPEVGVMIDRETGRST